MPENHPFDPFEPEEHAVLLDTGSIDTAAILLPTTTAQISVVLARPIEELVDDDVVGGEVRYELDESGAVQEITT